MCVHMMMHTNEYLNTGYNGSQTWDASLAIQAIISCDLNEEYSPTLRKANEFLKASQV